MKEKQYNSELDNLTQTLNHMALDNNTKQVLIEKIESLRARSGELKDNNEKIALLKDLEKVKSLIANAFSLVKYQKNISKSYLELDGNEIFKFGRQAALVKLATPDNKLNAINDFMATFDEIKEKLKAKEVVAKNPNTVTHKDKKINNENTESKKVDSTNSTLTRLHNKDGKIETHQRSVKVKTQEITRFRVQTIALAEAKAKVQKVANAQPMNNSKKVDKKIIGKRNSKELCSDLKQKSGYLVGGSGLTLPKQVIELQDSISNTRR